MNIAIDITPLKDSQHRVRGVGFYLTHLRDALLEYFPHNFYYFFSKEEKVPAAVDLIHYPYFDPFFLTLPLFKKKKTIVTIHDVTPLIFSKDFPSGKKGAVKWQIQKLALKNVNAIITDSFSSKKDIERICGIKPEFIHVVYLAAGEGFKKIPESEVDRIRKKYTLPKEFALYVGDATANKNLPRLISAVAETNKTLVLVGKALDNHDVDKTNPWNKDLIFVQNASKQNPSLRILGFVDQDDLVALYNAATAFVMPSLYEGFGLPVLEAMACGCPIIASNEGSLKEVVGDAGYFVDAYDKESIKEGIEKVMSDKKLQLELVKKGFEQIKKFSWEKTAQETIAVYKSVLGNQAI